MHKTCEVLQTTCSGKHSILAQSLKTSRHPFPQVTTQNRPVAPDLNTSQTPSRGCTPRHPAATQRASSSLKSPCLYLNKPWHTCYSPFTSSSPRPSASSASLRHHPSQAAILHSTVLSPATSSTSSKSSAAWSEYPTVSAAQGSTSRSSA